MARALMLALAIIGGILLVLAVIAIVTVASRQKLGKLIQTRFRPEEILGATTQANSFGEQSKGGKQLRGNGALVLTPHSLFFIRAVPTKEYEIPVQAITDVSLLRSFNGKSIGRQLLCVRYRVADQEDAMAWALPEPQQWQTAIAQLINR